MLGSRSCAHERNTIIGPLGTGTARGDLSDCVRPRDSSPVVQRRTWEALADSGTSFWCEIDPFSMGVYS